MSAIAPQPPPLPSRPAWPTFVAWVVIAACVVLIMLAGLRPHEAEPLAVEPAADLPPPNVDLLVQSRLAVGFDHLARMAGGPPTTASAATPMLAAIEDAAQRSTVMRLRNVPVVAEVAGVDAALKRLDDLAAASLTEPYEEDRAALRTIYAEGAARLDAATRDRLLARHGWFARLALTHGLSNDDPDRRAALAPATRAAVTAMVLGFLGLLALATGLILLVFGLVRFLSGRLPFAHVPPAPGRDGPFVEAFAVYLLGTVVLSIVLGAAFSAGERANVPLAANFLLALAVPPAIFWLRLRGVTWAEARAGLGWHRGRGWLREAFAGVVGYLAGLPLLAVALLVTSALARVSGTTPSHPIAEEAAGGASASLVLQLYLLAAVYAPVVEEIMFRGALYHHVRRRMPWWLAGAVVGLIFAAIHPQGWVGIPMLATIAVMLAVLREWRGSIVAPVVAHACVNGVTVTLLVLMAG